MIEVFITNIHTSGEADRLLKLIHKQLKDHRANFDLEDRDRILRVENPGGPVAGEMILSLVSSLGFKAEILDDLPPREKTNTRRDIPSDNTRLF
jgi:hypothetical protein